MTIPAIFSIVLCIRLFSLFISIRNEKRLKKSGGMEYGKMNSLFLTLAHIAFYISCITESVLRDKVVNYNTYAGIAIFLFSMIVLAMVINGLKNLWTVKLIIAPQHTLNTSFIFKYFRHPNYFLNIIPELIGIGLICQSWYTLMIGIPVYLIPLTVRIIQEEKVMKTTFANY